MDENKEDYLEEKKMINKMLDEGKINQQEAEKLMDSIKESYNRGVNQQNKTNDGFDKEQFKNLENIIKETVSAKDSSENVVRFNEEFEGQFSSQKVELDLNMVNGKLNIKSWEKDYFKCEIEHRIKAENLEEAKEVKKDLFQINIEDDKMEIQVERENEARIKLYLPQELKYNIKIDCRNTRIKIADLTSINNIVNVRNGKINLREITTENLMTEVRNGNINAEQITAKTINMNARNGNLNLHNIKTDIIEGNTRNGKISLRNIEASNGKFNSRNGSIYFEGNSNKVDANTRNGKIKIRPLTLDSCDINLKSRNGSIETIMPPECNFIFDIRTNKGKIKEDFNDDIDYIKKEFNKNNKHCIFQNKNRENEKENININIRTRNGHVYCYEN